MITFKQIQPLREGLMKGKLDTEGFVWRRAEKWEHFVGGVDSSSSLSFIVDYYIN